MEQSQLVTLVEQSRAGDRQAQEALVREAQNRVYYHCKKMLKNEPDALDATQDVLIAMLTGLDKLRQPAAFWGWLNGITANRCKHLLTQGTKEWQIPEDEDGGSLLDSVETLDDQTVPDKALDNAETQRLIMEIIDDLPPEQKMSVLFFYYDEMSVKEIAAAMEVSEGTVKSRLNYARRSIKAGVEMLAKKGTKLYGVSTLPFLAYFLHAGAQSQTLSPAAAASLVQGAVGTAATAGAAATTAGTTTAAAVGVKASAGVSAKVIAGVLAGTLTVGGIGAGVYLATRKEPEPSPTPAPVMAVVTPTPAPTMEITQTPTPTPAPTLEPSPTPSPSEESSPSPEPSPSPSPSPSPATDDFVIENGVLVKYNGPGGDVVIPDGVRVIGCDSFYGCKTLTGVTIPDGVTKIEGITQSFEYGMKTESHGAFCGCSKLTNVSLPDSLKEIGVCAFQSCYKLKHISIPPNVTVIGKNAFAVCQDLTRVEIPGSVGMIEEYAFYYCTSLTDVVIHDGVSAIGASAFGQCALTGITIPDSVTRIDMYAFSNCAALRDVTLGSGLTTLDYGVFCACPSLTELTFPANVSSIADHMFEGGTNNLTAVTILNPTVTFDGAALRQDDLASPSFTLHAPAGSTTEAYAAKYNIPFEPI